MTATVRTTQEDAPSLAKSSTDFIADFTLGPHNTEQLEGWILNVDGASYSKGAGIEIVLTTPEGSIIEQSFTLGFPTSNNEAEYKVILAGSDQPSLSG